MRAPALADTLSVILPTEQQTWLLRACLHSGDAGREAWEVWRAQTGDLRRGIRDGPGTRRLLPLLFSRLRRNGVEPDGALLTLLRVAQHREELRTTTVVGICRDVISELSAGGIAAILLKGAALAGTVYDDWVLRHCHDVDVFVRRNDLLPAARTLIAAGFRPLEGPGDRAAGDFKLAHARGLPVELHTRPFRPPSGEAQEAGLWSRTRTALVAGVPARILSPADSLLHVCGQAAYSPSRASLVWVCDAWHIIGRYPDLDWDALLGSAVAGHLALPLYVTLGYLAAELGAPVPETVLGQLSAAARTDLLGRECALTGARAGQDGSFRNLFRNTGGRRSRAEILKWMLLPSPRYLRWRYGESDPRFVSLYYLRRPLRYGARWISPRLGRVGPGKPP